ncbi:MAG: MtrB/PioB family outer membrane beta-barrel protein [Nitrospirota bacterium]
MKKILTYTAVLCALFLLSTGAYADEAKPLSGEIKAVGKLVNVDGNEAKFNEYRDLQDGVYGDIRLKYDNNRYFMKFNAGDIAYDTQSYKLESGMWGKFKFYLKYNEIPHNITYNARTIFSGAGTYRLTTGAVLVPANADPTNFFDYSVDRKQFEAGVKLDVLKPLYLDLSYAREDRDGIKPAGVALRTGGGSFFAEIPEPVDYVTNSLKAEVGYAKNPVFFSFAYFYSEFSNEQDKLFFVNPNSINTLNATRDDYLTLPPDNKYHNYSFKGVVKLPLYSALNVNIARSDTRSDFAFPMLNATKSYWVRDVAGGIQEVTLTDSEFDGKLTANSYSFVLTSRPVGFLGAKAFYKYYDKKNKSDEIGHTDSNVNGGSQFFNHLFDYEKRSYGVELDVKLPAKFSLTPAYSRLNTKRNRTDLPETTDNIYAVDLKWSGVDFMTAKVGYERLDRQSTKGRTETLFATDQAAADVVEPYIRRFDAAPMDRDTYKASIDIYPLDTLSFGLHYKNKKSEFTDTVLGLRDDKTNEYGIDADWRINSFIAVSGYVEYEETKVSQVQRASTSSAGLDPNAASFFTNTTTYQYTWRLDQKDKTYNYGIGAEIDAIPQTLVFNVQFDRMKSDGFADFSFFDGPPPQTSDISNWDDYRKTAFSVKAKYAVSKRLGITGGYAYEKFTYNDIAVDGYQYSYGTAEANVSTLTGAYSAPSYRANILFAGLVYKF